MAASRTLLEAGHPAWQRLNAEKREMRRRPAGESVEDLLRAGQRLSAQAAALRSGLLGDRGPARA